MENILTLIQFGSPWQAASGFEKLKVDTQKGEVVQKSRVEFDKVIGKTTKKVDGLVMKPSWPTQRRLCLIVRDNDVSFHELNGDQADFSDRSLSFNDPSFHMETREYVFFRKFIFSTDKKIMSFFDFSNRLISPERRLMRRGIDSHFSALSRLIDIMRNDEKRHQFLKDFKKRRFKYRKYFEDMKRQWKRSENRLRT